MLLDSDQQRGIIGLALVILLLTGLIYGLRNRTSQQASAKETPEEQSTRLFLDSVRRASVAEEQERPVISPFNPNFMTDYRGYVLGLSVEEIDRLKVHREAGLWVNSEREFQEVSHVSDSLLEKIAAYFKFPDWVKNASAGSSQKITSVPFRSDLNTATAKELQGVRGIGEVLANRIVRYRDRLGGFLGDVQLQDVYGLKTETRQAVLKSFTVKRKKPLNRQNLNSITTAELTQIPYFDYELARKIVEYRTTRKRIDSFDELYGIKGFPRNKSEQLKLYLKIEATGEP